MLCGYMDPQGFMPLTPTLRRVEGSKLKSYLEAHTLPLFSGAYFLR